MTNLLYANEQDVHRILNFKELVEELRIQHAAASKPVTDTTIIREADNSTNQFVNLTAWMPGQAIGVKVVSDFPGNTHLEPPLPSVQGLVLLFDGKNGRPLMVCHGTSLTYYKTAADSALGADILARPDARTLLVAGAGGLAPYVIRAHRTVRPSIDHVIIWNRSHEKALALVKNLEDGATKFMVADSITDVLPQADIVSTVTSSEKPFLHGKFLKPGTHVDLIGSYQPWMREADDDVIIRAGRVFMDIRERYDRTGDLSRPLADGVLAPEDICADLFDLCSGRHTGRQREDEITVFKNVGGGHLDLFVAMSLYNAMLR